MIVSSSTYRKNSLKNKLIAKNVDVKETWQNK